MRVLHDYYLYGVDPLETGNNQKIEKSFFAMNASAQSGHRLQELLRNGRYNIRKDLDFLVRLDGTGRMFDDLHLRMITT